MKRLPWVCWTKFILGDCAGGEAFTDAGERGLDRKGVFFVAAPLIEFFFSLSLSFLPSQEWPQGGWGFLTLWISSAFHSRMGISGSALFKMKEQSVHWQMKGKVGERLGVTCKRRLQGSPWSGGVGKPAQRSFTLGLWAHHLKHASPGRLGASRAPAEWLDAHPVFVGLPHHPALGTDQPLPALVRLRVQRA